MGEVYRARDTRLDREVAVKILQGELIPDASRLKRFEMEARSASALNHPNIVTIYDVGTSDSVSYIAMERVEGETLRKRLDGALPVRRLLQIAAQIADGLARAHEVGIVHRDLKPENIMVTKDGLVKILDFGLAKLTLAGSGSDDPLQPPTETFTSPGVLLGTVGYMSPEHAAGATVDFRSDQFAFGSILYEMASGKRAFQKKTAVETLAAILSEEPEALADVAPETPVPLRWIVERCLAKSPGDRYAATRDLARDLTTLRAHLGETSASGFRMGVAGRPQATFRRRALLWSALAASALALGILLAPRFRKPIQPNWVQVGFRRGIVWSGRFAPDGQTIVYSAGWDGDVPRLFSTRPGSTETRTLDLPPGKILAISRKSELAFLRDPRYSFLFVQPGTLVRAGLEGGVGRDLLENVQAADWSPDGTQLAVAREVDGGRVRLEYPAGKKVYETDVGGAIGSLRISRDGAWIALFERMSDGLALTAVRVADGERRILSRGWFMSATGLAWSADGREIWFTPQKQVRDSSPPLMAATLSGRVREILRGPGQLRLYDIAADGRLLIARWDIQVGVRGASPSEGRERELSATDDSNVSDLSRDGRSVLFFDRASLFLRATDGSPPVRLGEGIHSSARLSPDGKWVLTASTDEVPYPTLIPVGAGEVRHIGKTECDSAEWFADGKRILCEIPDPTGRFRIVEIDIASEKATELRVPESAADFEGGGPLSPDGTLLPGSARNGDILILSLAGAESRRIAAGTLVSNPSRESDRSGAANEPSSARPIPGSFARHVPVGWTEDGRHLFLHRLGLPARVEELDLATGRREPWKFLGLDDPAGVFRIQPVKVAADGRAWAFTYIRILSNLYVVEGLK